MKRAALLFGLLVLAGSGHASGDFGSSPQSVIQRYGKPDKTASNEYERPRAKSVFKTLIYRKQGVKFVFVPDAPEGTPPPVKAWKLSSIRDFKFDTALSTEDALKRMESRARPGAAAAVQPTKPGPSAASSPARN